MFNFISELSESKAYSSKASLDKATQTELEDMAFLSILALRILLSVDGTLVWAKTYCGKTTRRPNFKVWRTDATDLYIAMYGLVVDKEDHAYSQQTVWNWIHKAGNGELTEKVTKTFFGKLDSYFHIKNSALKAARRDVMEFDELKPQEKRDCIKDVLTLMNKFASKSELIVKLKSLSSHDFEENDKDPLDENATAGATNASNVASVPCEIDGTNGADFGAGFASDQHWRSVYGNPKPVVLRREGKD